MEYCLKDLRPPKGFSRFFWHLSLKVAVKPRGSGGLSLVSVQLRPWHKFWGQWRRPSDVTSLGKDLRSLRSSKGSFGYQLAMFRARQKRGTVLI